MYIVFFVRKFVNRDNLVIVIVMISVVIGILCLFIFWKEVGVIFLFVSDYSICVVVYNLEFVIDNNVVIIMKFIILVVYGILILLNMIMNGFLIMFVFF